MRPSGAAASPTSCVIIALMVKRSLLVIARVRIAFLPWVNDVDVTFVVTPDRHRQPKFCAVPDGHGNFKFAPLRASVFWFENFAHGRGCSPSGLSLFERRPELLQNFRRGGFWVDSLQAQVTVKRVAIVLAGEV